LKNTSNIRLSSAGILISLGIVFGDIGTSPLYVIKAIVGESIISRELILGGLSCVFWTLTIITSFKYVYLALNSDNKGEGGIFALYVLMRKSKAKWPIIVTMIGCCSLIADGFITPPISISAAIEGLNIIYPEIHTVPVVIVIIIILFTIQQFGTGIIGKSFGPMMLIWFSLIAILGGNQLIRNPEVLAALNPYYAFNLLVNYPQGFWLLGAVFLCTTGAEALYSDLGHCGKANIRVSWAFVKLSLLLSYFGQSAWVLQFEGSALNGQNPFYAIMPGWFVPIGIWVATSAAIIASQALISGSFSLIRQAILLRIWPNMRINYPTKLKGQLYIPAINWILFIGCIVVLLLFQKSSNMEAAYGLAIIINMLMTSALMVYLYKKQKQMLLSIVLGIVFFIIEGTFLISNSEKFVNGGWFTVLIAATLFSIMYVLYWARKIRDRHIKFVKLQDYIPIIKDLQEDLSIPKEAGNLVYMSMADNEKKIDENIIHSLLRKRPKRADIYWFLHVEVLDEPFEINYSVDTIIPGRCFFVKLNFGFKVEHKVNLMFSQIVQEMVNNGEVDELSRFESLRKYNLPTDFKFILMKSMVSVDSDLGRFDQLGIRFYRFLKTLSLPTHEEYGLELANIEVESVPIHIAKPKKIHLRRIED
jgi:KUP system potassium uptake protein